MISRYRGDLDAIALSAENEGYTVPYKKVDLVAVRDQ